LGPGQQWFERDDWTLDGSFGSDVNGFVVEQDAQVGVAAVAQAASDAVVVDLDEQAQAVVA
jgi:hypothetical protein